MADVVHCACGAAGDLGEMVEHCASKLGSGEDAHELDVEEPERIGALRAKRERLEDVRARLADVAGVTVDELREALRL